MSVSAGFGSPQKRSASSMEEVACLADVVSYLSIVDKARLMISCVTLHHVAGDAIHWQSIALNLPFADDANSLVSCVRQSNAQFPLLSLQVEGASDISLQSLHCEDDEDSCAPCSICTQLTCHLEGWRFQQLHTLVLHKLPWLTSCVAEHLIRHSPKLITLDIEQNIDVNRVVSQVAVSCPDIQVLSFKHIEVWTALNDSTIIQRCLEASTIKQLTVNCKKLQVIRLNHYVIEEDAVEGLLQTHTLLDVDLSDNEGLHGFFLVNIPREWPSLRTLKLRDCTEVQETAVTELTTALVNGACPNLVSIDVSCQWSHVNESFLNDEVLRAELTQRRPKLQWLEDHCQIPGFGIDPDEEVWYCMLSSMWLYYGVHGQRILPSRITARSHTLRFLRRAAQLGLIDAAIPTAAA